MTENQIPPDASIYEATLGKGIKIFRQVRVINTTLKDNASIGDESLISDSIINENVAINRRNVISNAIIGAYTYTGINTHIIHCNIGKYCSISWNVTIGGGQHDYHKITTHPFRLFSKYGFFEKGERTEGYASFEIPLTIDNDVWIGAGAIILRGVRIGNGAIIGAG